VSRRALLRDRALLALLARDVISTAGSQMTWVALPWFVVTTTGSATKMAIVVAVEAAALGIVGFAAGNVVGRLGLRRTMLVADACRAPLIAAVPILYSAGLLSFPLLLVLVFAVGVFGTPSFVSKAAVLPEIVGEDEGVLGEANALLQAAMRTALVLGPVLAGVLIGLVGATNVLYIDAATFVVGFLLIAFFVRVGGTTPDTEESRGLGAGVRFLLRDRLLRPWSIAIVAGDTAWLTFFVAMPFLVVTRFGERPEILGWILGAWGMGAVAGSALIFRFVRRVDGLLVGSIGELAMILPIWIFVAGPPAVVLVAAMFVSGLANGLVNAPIWTIFTLRTPPALRPKAWAAIIATTSLIGPLALLITGWALDSVGLTQTLLVIVLVQTVAALLFTSAGLRERIRHKAGAVTAGARA
jgi:MFS family permease